MNSDDLDHGRPKTPPHHPTAGVKVLREEVLNIVAFAFPESEILSITQLESGKSYNNRIYFIKLRHQETTSTPDSKPQDVVLKVNGRFFGANKIENEVTCLQLIQRYCPELPVPRALAWSGDGRIATHGSVNKTALVITEQSPDTEKSEHGGWLLMTRVPGNPMAADDLDDETLRSLARQLGDIMASLRQRVPPQAHIGNVRLPPRLSAQETVPLIDGSTLIIRDIIPEGITFDKPLTSANDYFRLELQDKLRQLETSDFCTPNRHLSDPVRKFISDRLPHLNLGEKNNSDNSKRFVLTHHDLSPRNVLVSGSPPRITGFVDFEFAGFFPDLAEFTNDIIAKEGGEWPAFFYEAYTARLFENGVATPGRGVEPEVWDRNVWMARLAGAIVPWDLPGGLEGEALQARLDAAAAEVEEMLERLNE